MSNAVASGVAGAGAGIIAQIITYPLQTVNTRQQTERVIAKKSKSIDDIASGGGGGGTLAQMLQVINTEGWGGLYSGLKPSLLGTAASQGVYYYFYQLFKNKAEALAASRKKNGHGDGTPGMFSWLVVAAAAGSLNVLLTIPIWVVVTRMQTHTQAERKIMESRRQTMMKDYLERGISDPLTLQEKLEELENMKPRPYGTLLAAKEVYDEAGIRGFWKGIVPTLIMVCNPSIQFMIYESALKQLRVKKAAKKNGPQNVTAMEVFLSGAVAKLGATVATYPLLVVKSRLQAKQEIGENSSLRYKGTFDAIIKMIRYEGLLGFYKGMSTKIVQSVFAASLLFMMKEELIKAYILLENKTKKALSSSYKKLSTHV